jgi:hypothetical protein
VASQISITAPLVTAFVGTWPFTLSWQVVVGTGQPPLFSYNAHPTKRILFYSSRFLRNYLIYRTQEFGEIVILKRSDMYFDRSTLCGRSKIVASVATHLSTIIYYLSSAVCWRHSSLHRPLRFATTFWPTAPWAMFSLCLSLYSWFSTNSLSFNASKSNSILFSTRQRLRNFPPDMQVDVAGCNIPVSLNSYNGHHSRQSAPIAIAVFRFSCLTAVLSVFLSSSSLLTHTPLSYHWYRCGYCLISSWLC